MFCPQCNAEYRSGFTRCSDCDVDLVEDPPHFALAGQPSSEPGDPNEDPFCSFWKGQEARVHGELCEILDEAGIPHKTVFRSDHLFNFSNYPAFEIGIPFSLFEKAEKVIEEAFGTDDIGNPEPVPARSSQTIRKLPLELAPEEARDFPGPPAAGDDADWYPEDATEQVWSTDSDQPSEFLVAALHENGIHCRTDQQGTRAAVFVMPHDAARAREILREIADATPPHDGQS